MSATSGSFLADEFRRRSIELPSLNYVRISLRDNEFTPEMRWQFAIDFAQAYRGPGHCVMHADGEGNVDGVPFHHMIFAAGNIVGDFGTEAWRVFSRMAESAIQLPGWNANTQSKLSPVFEWLTILITRAGEKRQSKRVWTRSREPNVRITFERLDDLWNVSAEAVEAMPSKRGTSKYSTVLSFVEAYKSQHNATDQKALSAFRKAHPGKGRGLTVDGIRDARADKKRLGRVVKITKKPK